MDNKVNVVIGGEIITLRSSEPADYLQRIALYSDEKINEIKAKSVSAAIDDRVCSLLIALNIADDYHKALDKFQKLDALHKRFVTEMSLLQEENAKISKRVKELETELAGTKKELEEFIKSFDDEGNNILTLPQNPPRKAAR
jgi:cell division protein ZapA